MTVSAFATAVVATAITAAVASATATTFATHHFHQFLDFFVSSRTAFQYFTFENQITALSKGDKFDFTIPADKAYGNMTNNTLLTSPKIFLK